MMKCIFCLQEKPSSDEHVIPDSIGGTLCIKEVCRECNSDLSRLVDNPFASNSLIKQARHTHSLGGKRDNVPFPFGGIGTIDTGQKVSLDRNFNPHLKRTFNVSKLPDGNLKINFSADASDKDKLEAMLEKPLRKELIAHCPDCSQEQLDKVVNDIIAQAKAQQPKSINNPIKIPMSIKLDDLLFEFLKIAYEMWFRSFGYLWVENSPTAKTLRTAILNRDSNMSIRGQLFCPDVPLPVSDPLKNHMILQSDGTCLIRLFNINCAVECEEKDVRFKLKEQDYRITIQDFTSGELIEHKLLEFVSDF